jgi:Flp pilus assembly CpaF family ATPase
MIKADSLDFRKLFPTVLGEVERHGEAVVETQSAVYILRPEAVERLREYSSTIAGADLSRLYRARAPSCGDCINRRRRAVGEAVALLLKGDAESGKRLLEEVVTQRGGLPECEECTLDALRVLKPLMALSAKLGVEDFTRIPVVSSFTKVSLKGAELVEEYLVRIPGGQSFTVRILREHGRYWYDPVLPVEVLSPDERELLNRVMRAIVSSAEPPEKVVEGVLEEAGATGSLLKPVLDAYISGLGDLQFLLYDRKHLTDIFVYPNGIVTVSSYDRDMECTLRLTRRGLETLATSYRLVTSEELSESSPLSAHFWEEHNCRISALGYTANYTKRPDFAIRLWPEKPWHVLNLVERGALDTTLAALLTAGMNLGAGMIIGGGPGSGKSTLLQAAIFMIPRGRRKVAFLTAREIHSWFSEHRFRISEMRVHTSEEVTMQGAPISRALKQALIHGDAIWIFNEIKFEDEARPFFTAAAAAGQSAVLTTMHAKSALGIVQRLQVDFRLPVTVLRVIKWIPVAVAVQKPGSTKKHRLIRELTEVLPFKRDPVDENAIKSLVKYSRRKWEYVGVGEITDHNAEDFVRESPFLTTMGELSGLDAHGVGELILLFRDIYDRVLEWGVPEPELFTSLMEALFSSFPEEGFSGSEREEVFERWIVQARRIL